MIDITASVLVYYKKERQPIDGSLSTYVKENNRKVQAWAVIFFL